VASLSPGFRRVSALRHKLGRVFIQVEEQLLVELLFHRASPPQTIPPRHCAPLFKR
jgi:hypothetical protein